MRALPPVALLAVATWLWWTPALAATFVLDNGSRIDGTIVHATRNTLTIRPAIGGLRQVPLARLERVEVTTRDGQALRGSYRGWAEGRSAIEVGTDLLWLENDRVVERRSLTTPALASAPGPSAPAADETSAVQAPAVAHNAPRADQPPPRSSENGPPQAEAGIPASPEPPRRGASTITAPLPPRDVPAAAAEPAAGPTIAALSPPDLPVVSIHTSPEQITESSGEITFTIELSHPIDDLLVVIYSTIDGTAQAGAHYEPLQGILTLPAGATSAEIRTAVIDDAERGGDTEFQLFLASNPSLATVDEQWTKVTIQDDD